MSNIGIEDQGTGSVAKVTTRGQLITSALDFSNPINITLTSSDTAVNFVAPQSGQIFIITDIILSSGSGASQLVEIYEADSATDLVATKTLLPLDMGAKNIESMIGLNWKLTPGKWLNAKSSGTTSAITIAGYFAQK